MGSTTLSMNSATTLMTSHITEGTNTTQVRFDMHWHLDWWIYSVFSAITLVAASIIVGARRYKRARLASHEHPKKGLFERPGVIYMQQMGQPGTTSDDDLLSSADEESNIDSKLLGAATIKQHPRLGFSAGPISTPLTKFEEFKVEGQSTPLVGSSFGMNATPGTNPNNNPEQLKALVGPNTTDQLVHLSEFDIDDAIASLSEQIGATSRSEDELSSYSARLLDRDFHSSSSIAFHAFAPLEAQHACDPIACLSGVHSLTD
jgi:hypothetical protein